MCENIEILNLSQPKEEETIWCQKQITIQQNVSQKIAIGMKKTLIRLHKTKIWRKCKTLLYGYEQLHYPYKNR